jgi:hypothetical protein
LTAKTPLSKADMPSGGEAASATGAEGPQPRAPAQPRPDERGFVVASHEALFVDDSLAVCDACGGPLEEDETDPPEGYRVPGHGAYLWSRGDETRIENVPLCASCASAIGMTALARWEIEEEEG